MLDRLWQSRTAAGGLRDRHDNFVGGGRKQVVFVGDEKVRILQEEIFGRCWVTRLKDIDDAIKISNDAVYGLGAGVCPAIMIAR